MGGKSPSIVVPAAQPAPEPPASAPVSNNAPTQQTLQPGQQDPTNPDNRDLIDKANAKAKARAAAAQTIVTAPLGLSNSSASTGKAKLGN